MGNATVHVLKQSLLLISKKQIYKWLFIKKINFIITVFIFSIVFQAFTKLEKINKENSLHLFGKNFDM